MHGALGVVGWMMALGLIQHKLFVIFLKQLINTHVKISRNLFLLELVSLILET
jgi:hypothetical protein